MVAAAARWLGLAAAITASLFSGTAAAQADAASRLESLKQTLAEQTRALAELKRAMAEQEARLDAVRRAVDAEAAAASTAGPSAAAAPAARRGPVDAVEAVAPAPPASPAPAQPAPIFEQPSVLTPAGRTAFEPSLQYTYSSSNRIAIAGYAFIPALIAGSIDVREVKRSTFVGAVTLRHGISSRLEIEAKLPYVYRSDTSIGREVLQGSNAAAVFNASGHGVGDAELTARYQLDLGGNAAPYYVASLRLKSRTGTDPFEVPVTTGLVGFRGDGLQRELPTGSGFYGVQPALSVLYPSDPAVLFGSVSYLHSVKRRGVVRPTDEGVEVLGTVAPGGIVGFNVGLGLALNEKSSFSIGYDHASVGRTRLNGAVAPESVRLQLGTLLLGFSYRLDDRRTVNLSLGAGLTRDTPDVALTWRLPTSF